MRVKNILGLKFNKLQIIKFIEVKGKMRHSYWLCRCDCGKEKEIRGSHVTSGQTKSCGCFLVGTTKTKEHKLKISKTLTGRINGSPSLETRIKIGKNQKGKKHWNWKNGITPKNTQLRDTIEYKQWRSEVYKRDKYTCVLCKKQNINGERTTLNAHHIKSFAKYPKLRFEIDNGITLCVPCHKLTDNYKNNNATS
jgi:5-methylcytosine-specific restriction endonuclease McrA